MEAVKSAIAATAADTAGGGKAALSPRQLKEKREDLTRALANAKRDNKKAQGEVRTVGVGGIGCSLVWCGGWLMDAF